MNLLKRAGIPWCFLLFFYTLSAGTDKALPQFNFSSNCNDAQKYICTLRLDHARALLQAERKLNPDNVAVDYLEDYIDYYALITNQDVAELKKLEKNKDLRITQIKKSTPSSPYYLYSQAEINLHWAFAHVLNHEYVTAAFEFRSAFNLLEANNKKYPLFNPNKKSLGMLRAVVGTLPDNFRWVLGVIGMKGNLQQGLQEIREYLKQQDHQPEHMLEKQSAEFYYTLLLLNFGDKQECWKFCAEVTADYETNLLSAYLRAFTGIKTAHSDEVIETCTHRPRSADYMTLHMMDFFMGKARLNRLDKDADIYFKKFVTFYKGANLIKDAYKQLSWFYLLEGDTNKFNTYRGLAIKYGAGNSDEDKNAQKESEEGILPDPVLLKARLLFDGGYFVRATEVIKSHNMVFANTYQKIEYYYRYGRIMQGSEKFGKAIEMFNRVIRLSAGQTLYFAPASCLQLGYIYEKLGYKEQARQSFEKSLTYKNYEYRSGVSQEAKAGISRLQ